MTTQLDAVNQEQLPYRIGDTVVHPVHGIGIITRLEETRQAEQSRLYYVMDIHDKCTLWVPVDGAAKSGMRSVVSASGFTVVSGILSSAAQPLNEQARDRQVELHERFSQGTLEAICSIIRDRGGVTSIRPRTETVPPTKLPTAAIMRAGPARPRRAIS